MLRNTGSAHLPLQPLQEAEQQLGHGLRAFLLHPVAGAGHQLAQAHVGAGARLHRLEQAGATAMTAGILKSQTENCRAAT